MNPKRIARANHAPERPTQALVRAKLAAVGISFRNIAGEFRVVIPGTRDPYFTDDLLDALDAGLELAARREHFPPVGYHRIAALAALDSYRGRV